MFADLSVVKRRCALCLLKLFSRLRETQHRIQQIDTLSHDMLYFIILKTRVLAYAKRYFE